MNANTQLTIAAASDTPTQPLADLHDRVTEAYYGKMGVQFMHETQQRIHWVCGKVQGQRILDVGCSQGITAILLGREGKSVLALDAAPRSIDQAKQYLEDEPGRVRENVSFVNADFLHHDFGGQRFDTVIIAEVLEHLLQPEAFVEAAARQLEADGRLIVTVPFGVNDFIDHKHTFYLLEPYRLMSRHFDVIDVIMFGKWLGLVGRRRAADVPASAEQFGAELVARLEASFLQLEQALRDDAGRTRGSLNDANLKYRAAAEQIATFKQRIAQEEQARKQGETAVAQLQQQLKQSELALAQAGASAGGEQAAHRETLARLDAEREALAGRLAEAQEALRGHADLIQAEREQLNQAKLAREAAEQAIAHLNGQLAAAEQRAAAEQQARRDELERLGAERQAVETALKEANLKYRSATDQIATFKQRIAQEEQARKQGDGALAQLQQQLGQAEQALLQLRAEFNETAAGAGRERAAHAELAARFEAERQDLLARLAGEQEAARSGAALIQAERAQLSEARHAREMAEQAIARLSGQLAAAEQMTAHLTAQLETAQQRVDSEREARHDAEKRLIRFEVERQALESALNDANLKYRGATERIEAFQASIEQEVRGRLQGEALAAQLQQRLGEAEASLGQARAESAAAAAGSAEQRAAHDAHLARLEAQHQSLQARLAETEQALRDSGALLQSERAQLSQAIEAREVAEQAIAHLGAQLAQAEQRAESEQQARREQVEGLEAALAQQRESRHQAETLLAKVEAERTAATLRLEEIDCKYRVATERVALLKQRVQEDAAAAEAQTGQINALTGKLADADRVRGQLVSKQKAAEESRQKEVAKLSAKIKELTLLRNELRSSLEGSDARVRAGAEQLAALEGELAAACDGRAQLMRKEKAAEDARQKEVAKLTAKIKELTLARNAARSQADASDALLRDSAQQLAALDAQLAAAQAGRDEAARLAAERQAALTDELAAAQAGRDEAARLAAERQAALADELAAAQAGRDEVAHAAAQRQGALVAQVEELAASREQLQSRLDEAAAQLDTGAQQLAALGAELAAARAQYDALERDAAERHAAQVEQVAQLATLREELQGRLDASVTQLQAETERLAALEQQHGQDSAALRASLNGGKRKLAAEQAAHAESERKSAELSKKLAAAKASATLLAKQAAQAQAELETRNAALSRQVGGFKQSMREAETKLAQRETALAELQARARRQAESACATEARLIVERNALEAELLSIRQENERQARLAALQADMHQRTVASLENRALAVKQTLSFRLGNLLINSKVPSNLVRLPAAVWRLRNEAKERALVRGEKAIGVEGGGALEKVLAEYTRGGFAGVENLLATLKLTRHGTASVYTGLTRHLQSVNPGKAVQAAKIAYQVDPQPFRAKWLAFRLFDAGIIVESATLLNALPDDAEFSPSETKKAGEIKSLAKLWVAKPHLEHVAHPAYPVKARSILYVAASALPYHTSGYTTRTHSLLRALAQAGIKLNALTRPGYPWDRNDRNGTPAEASTQVGHVEYHHVRHPAQSLPLDLYLQEAGQAIAAVAREQRVALIQAASNHVNALPALLAARQLGIPFHYEMRGLWELTRAAKIADYEETERFKLGVDLEAFVATNADQVYVISEQLGDYIESHWGVQRARIALLPNCINTEDFEGMAARTPAAFTIGYAGSLVPYEGLDLLVEAVNELAGRRIRVCVKLIGEGESRAALEQQVKELGLTQQIEFLGNLPPQAARQALSAVSAICIPRKPHKVCEIVPPIKLAEAMALGKPTIVPDLPVFRSEVREGETGYFFKSGDVKQLAKTIEACLTDADTAGKIGAAGRARVLADRTWAKFAEEIAAKLAPAVAVPVKPKAAALVKPKAAALVKPKVAALVKPKAAALVKPKVAALVKPKVAVPPVQPKVVEPVQPKAAAPVKPQVAALVQPQVVAAPVQPQVAAPAQPHAAEAIQPQAAAPAPPVAAAAPVLSNADQAYLKLSAAGAKGVIAQIRGQFAVKRDCARELLRVGKILGEAGRAECEYALAQAALETDHSESVLRGFFWAAQRSKEFGAACDAIFHLEKIAEKQPTPSRQQTLDKLKASPAYLLSILKLIKPRGKMRNKPVSRRVCYILHNSLPYSSGGYGTRSHGVASGLKEAGYDVVVLTRPGFPVDIKPELVESETPSVDVLDGIDYVRTFAPQRPGLSVMEYISQAADALEIQLKKYKPELVMAASNHVTGLPALIAARRLGIPFIYEVRGLWEITRMSRDAEFAEKPAFVIQKLLEAAVAQEADHVFTLTEPMREELVARGVGQRKIDLLPNSCDPSRFVPRQRDQALAQRLGLPPSVPVIGYIGTFVDYEGLDDLASACALLKRDGTEFRLLLVGNENASGQDRGPITEMIAAIAEKEGFSDWLIMPGRIPHEEVESYYSLLDVCPFPRKPLPVCEMVSPMKPLEALAMEKAVVVSSVRALTEMIAHEHTGLVFEKGNVRSMADTLARLIGDNGLRASLGVAGRKWVEESRTWRRMGQIAKKIIGKNI